MDSFARSLLEEAKRYLELARNGDPAKGSDAHLHAALMLAFCSLEAHVNAIAKDFMHRPELSVHEKDLLLEKDVRLEGGAFSLKDTLRMARLEERIEFLHAKFGTPLDTSSPYWSRLAEATRLRNELTHPKDTVKMTVNAVGRALEAIIQTLDALYRAIYRRPFPAAGLGLQSRLSF